jgi:hypothetical protein
MAREFPRSGIPTQSVQNAKTHADLHIKCPLLLSDFEQNWNMSNFSKTPKNLFSRSQVISCIRMDGWMKPFKKELHRDANVPKTQLPFPYKLKIRN